MQCYLHIHWIFLKFMPINKNCFQKSSGKSHALDSCSPVFIRDKLCRSVIVSGTENAKHPHQPRTERRHTMWKKRKHEGFVIALKTSIYDEVRCRVIRPVIEDRSWTGIGREDLVFRIGKYRMENLSFLNTYMKGKIEVWFLSGKIHTSRIFEMPRTSLYCKYLKEPNIPNNKITSKIS